MHKFKQQIRMEREKQSFFYNIRYLPFVYDKNCFRFMHNLAAENCIFSQFLSGQKLFIIKII